MSQTTMTLPKPGKALVRVMVALFAIWLMFAIAVNWAGASGEVFLLFCGNTELILEGEVWRLFTAPLIHFPQGNIGHILFVLLGLYFLTPTLEERWGGARTVRFLFFSGVLAYAVQVVFELVLPADIAAKLVNTGVRDASGPYWFGAFPVVEAVAIAWALTFRGQVVRLFFVLPVTSRGLILFVVGISLLRVIAASTAPEGLIAPFGGMAAGWLLGAGTPSPLRRAYLKVKLAQLDREATRGSEQRKKRVQGSSFRVIDGGQGKDDKSDDKGPDGRWLN